MTADEMMSKLEKNPSRCIKRHGPAPLRRRFKGSRCHSRPSHGEMPCAPGSPSSDDSSAFSSSAPSGCARLAGA
eukprot:1526937-Prymnesium_polylepis.3